MSTQSIFQRLTRSAEKRADIVFTALGFPGRFPIATHDRSYQQWIANDGDTTHRVRYELSPEDIVFDVGGYHGDWAAEIVTRYGSTVHVFEPVSDYFELIRERFRDQPKVRPHQFGLSAANESISLGILDDSTSQFRSAGQTEVCQLRSISEFLESENITSVALLKLNIEGGEYDLLEHLIATRKMEMFANIQVQFHWFVPDARRRMAAIQEALKETHSPTYQYPFVWENWSLGAA